MKGLLFAIAAFCIMFLSCSFSSQRGLSQKHDNDTTVCSELIFDEPFEEWEYFVVIGKDTSAYSCAITQKNGKCGHMTLYRFINHKYYMHTKSRDKNDTTAVGGVMNIPKRVFRVPCYKEMLHEIDLCLESASKKFDLSTLRSFNAFLSDLGDIAVLTTKKLNSHFVEEEGEYSCADITKALKMTSFIDDFNKVLNKYGFEIEDIICDGMKERFEKEVYLNFKHISKEIEAPDYIMNVEVHVIVKKLGAVKLE